MDRPVVLQGWGPDFTEIIARCRICTWEHVWDDEVTVEDLAEMVNQHMEEKHGDR